MKRILPLFSAYIIIYALLTASSAFAQLTVTQGSAMNMTPEQLVQNYLIGTGITISNVTYNNSPDLITSNQIGTFQTAGSATVELGLAGGILMTSGKAEIAIGPNNKAGAGANASGGGDPDLNIISGSITKDKCVIEFDFIPQSDTVRFRYVFGSEEFYEYCGQFNDAFGFFLSGPGITGTFSNSSVNIALMPGSTQYVTINNICDNNLSNWNNSGGVNFQYDGLTYVFTAWHVVTPCTTYHIKLAVADAVDNAYDSGVFLEENSFSSPAVGLNLNNTSPYLTDHALEACNDVKLLFTLEAPLSSAYTVKYNIGGTAQNGVDYVQIPDQVTFPQGEDSVFVTIHPIPDAIPENEETVIIHINQISCDGSVAEDTVYIGDYTPMNVTLRPDTVICHGTSLKFISDVTGGIRPYTYQWSNSTVTDSVLITTLPVGENYVVSSVTDICPNVVKDTTRVTVHPKPVANAGTDLSIPNGTSTTLHGTASNGTSGYEYHWTSNPPGFTSNEQNPNTGNLYYTTIFVLTVTDITTGCESDPSQIIVAVAGGVLSANPAADPSTVCLGDPVTLYALAGGGSGLYTYSWSSVPSGFTSTEQSPVAIPGENTTYHVSVNDGFNTVNGSTNVTVNPLPYIHLGPLDSTVCIYDSVVLDAGNPGSSYVWSNGAETRSITVSSVGLSFEIQTYMVTVTNANGCKDSATIHILFSFDDCVGIAEKNNFRDFNIYPNPGNGTFTLTMNPAGDKTWLDIYSISGEKVYSDFIIAGRGKVFKKEISIPGAASGIYLLQLYGDGFSGTSKLLVK